jgi:uncharacterized protein (DUF2249 family)
MSLDIQTEPNVHVFDARGVARRFRHSAILGAVGVLRSGETMRFVNDHDPVPLISQLHERLGEHLTVTYRQREPGAVVVDLGISDLPVECCATRPSSTRPPRS